MRGTAWAAGATAAAVVLAAGCGSVHDHGTAGGAGQGRTTAAVTSGPTTITRQDAERLAQDLLSRAVVPASARRYTGHPVKALEGPPSAAAGRPSVLLHKLWTVPGPIRTVDTFLTRHVPAGMAWDGSGQAGYASGVPQSGKLRTKPPGGVQPGNVGTITEEFVSYRLIRLPAGVSLAALSMAVTPVGPDMSQLRADVQVTWYPPRSAAEYVPAAMRAVTITVSYLTPKLGDVSRTVTSPAEVRRLAALLNGAHASTGGLTNCPMIWVTYRLVFAATARGAPGLTATYGGCGTVQVTVGGRAQPPLVAPAGLSAALAGLMHVRVVPNTGVIAPSGHGVSHPRATAASTPTGSLRVRLVPPACVKPLRGVWSGTPPGSMRNYACPAGSSAAP